MKRRIALILAVSLPWAGSSPAWAMVARVPAAVGKGANFAAAGAAITIPANLPSASENPTLVLSLISQRYGTDPSPDHIADLGEGDYAEVRSGVVGEQAVAVKIPYIDPGGMIAHEAAVAKRLHDAGGAEIFIEAIEDPELGVLVMPELEDYKSLDAWMDGRDQLGLKSFKRIARQLLKGLDVLEAAGLVHSDLRPSNIMIGPGLDVKVVDFGIAADKGGYVPYPDYSGWRGGHYLYTSANQLKNGPAAFIDDQHSVNVVLGELGRLVPRKAAGVVAAGDAASMVLHAAGNVTTKSRGSESRGRASIHRLGKTLSDFWSLLRLKETHRPNVASTTLALLPWIAVPSIGSYATHEFGHYLAAKLTGTPVGSVKFFYFESTGWDSWRSGGWVYTGVAKTPLREFLVNIAGPVFSMVHTLLVAGGLALSFMGFAAVQGAGLNGWPLLGAMGLTLFMTMLFFSTMLSLINAVSAWLPDKPDTRSTKPAAWRCSPRGAPLPRRDSRKRPPDGDR